MNGDTINHWWLNTNPKDWQVLKHPIGLIDTERTHSNTGRRQVYRNFKEVRPGDLVVGYETGPTMKVLALYRITKGLHEHPKDGEVIEFKLIEKVRKPLHWDTIKNHSILKHSMPVRVSNRGSLFSLSSEEYHTVIGLVQ